MARRAEIEEFARLHNQRCVAMGHSLPLSEIELMARTMFPAGTLPDETAPIPFTVRELEIFRNLMWQTDETWQLNLRAEVDRCDRLDESERSERARVKQSKRDK
jgi:hypothetical protein